MNRFGVLFGLMIVLAWGVRAQEGPPPPGERGPENHRMMERVERVKKVRMIEMLELNEDQSARFVARMNEHEAKRREFHQQRQELLDRIDRLIRNRAEERELEKAFAEMGELQVRLTEEGNTYFSGLREILTPIQRGKLLLFERQFDRELREAFREAQRRRGRSQD